MLGKVTKRSVDALRPATAADVLLWDRELRGFGVRVKPSGATSFVVAYYAPGLYRVRRRMTIGTYPAMTAARARDKARALLGRVADGADPAGAESEERRAVREATVAKLWPRYLDHALANFRPRTAEFFESLGRLYVLPALGQLPVKHVTPRDVAALHADLRDKPVTGNRVVRVVRAFYNWMRDPKRALFDGPNPVRFGADDWYEEHGRERFLSIAEVARLGAALRAAETVGLPPAPEHRKPAGGKRARNPGMFTADLRPAYPPAVAALRFLLFSGWREQEVLTLEWSAVNLGKRYATFSAKGRRRNRQTVRVLNAPACEVLAAQPRVKGSLYVFPSPLDPMKPLREIQRLWYAARSEARLENCRLHDLRHSVASFAGGRGYSLFLIGRLLGQRDTRSAERYSHLADTVLLAAADDVGEVIREALESDPETAHLAAPVTPLRGRR
jgi:integrase